MRICLERADESEHQTKPIVVTSFETAVVFVHTSMYIGFGTHRERLEFIALCAAAAAAAAAVRTLMVCFVDL